MMSDFIKITDEMLALHLKKNQDYGDAFKKSLDEHGLLVAKIRLGDKLSRFSTLTRQGALVNDESIRDTLIDMASYAAMTIMWMDALEETSEEDTRSLADIVKEGLTSTNEAGHILQTAFYMQK